jgi:hypothetical protein
VHGVELRTQTPITPASEAAKAAANER